MTVHPIVHAEISAAAVEAARRFDRELAGRNARQMAEFDATTVAGDGGPGDGLPHLDGQPHATGRARNDVDTDDIAVSLAMAESRGGQIAAPRTETSGIGWFDVCTDPTSNHVALVTSRDC